MAMQTGPGSPAQTSASVPYPPLPASPTLTNPDMILPDYDDNDSLPDRAESPLMIWKNAHAADMQFDLPSKQSFPMGPVTANTPIIYGNGTMLSDIGEVTEVESTYAPSRCSISRGNRTLRSSPTIDNEIKRRKEASRMARERRSSIGSNSTITTIDQNGLFADFDDAISVGDSNFQGDDEESVAESYADDAVPEERSRAIPISNGLAEEERFSTALSRRAEQILANAKRRLTTMEGNLSRARTSLSSPTFSMDSDLSSFPAVRPATAFHLAHDSGYARSGHSRISSENGLSTESKLGAYTQRSSSALGAAGGYRPPRPTSHSLYFLRNGSAKAWDGAPFAQTKNVENSKEYALEPLSEDEVSEELESSRPSLEDSRLETFLSPTFGSFTDKGLTRSASTAQMRDIKDHMKDLKGRLSTLRDQARADSMKRRSLQSLRTPSPFTHARVEQWYAGAGTGTREEEDGVVGGVVKPHGWNGDLSSVDENEAAVGGPRGSDHGENEPDLDPETANSDPPYLHLPEKDEPAFLGEEDDGIDDMQTEDGYDDDNNVGNVVFDDDDSESGESSYHDSVQNQLSHEDREDAFDYEHFFLHSAMGSMSRKGSRRRDSGGSVSSEDSIETTRGPIRSTRSGGGNANGRGRRGSVSSTTSVDSFATANDERSLRGENDSVDDREDVTEQTITLPGGARSQTPDTARRTAFSPGLGDSGSEGGQPRALIIDRPQSSAAAFMHRPSLSSLESAGTTRSFPLVNKPKVNMGVLTPRASPDQELSRVSETLLEETASVFEKQSMRDGAGLGPIETLATADQLLVQRLVASLGKCVLGLSESGRASPENRVYRRRIETARRILEGSEPISL